MAVRYRKGSGNNVSWSFFCLQKKGFFFTVDALLAASILLGGLIILSSNYISTQPTIHLNYLSQDIINCLDTLKINELNNSYVDGLIANGNITDTNNSILQQVGEFWAAEKFEIARMFMGNITEDILPDRYGFGMWISEDLIYQRDNPPPSSRSSARKLISGIEKKKPVKGFISKARANNFIKVGTEVISFSPEGAGWEGDFSNPGEVVIQKYFELPANINVTNSTFYVSLHMEDDGPDWQVININNGLCTINRDQIDFFGGEEGTFDIINIAGCIHNGTNKVTLRLRNPGYNGHIHPGMLIKVDYNINESTQTYNNTFSKRYYFDNLTSNEGSTHQSGAWASLPFYIPEDAVNISVSMRIAGKNIRNYTGSGTFSSWSGWKYMRDYDYILFVNGGSPFASSANPAANPVYSYNSSQISSKLVDGTNVVSVYFNNYGDSSWGGGHPQIYSDPINYPNNSSYVEVNYSLPQAVAPYGSIKITHFKEFGGSANWLKETSFKFPQQAIEMGDVFTHIVQQYSYIVDVRADTYTPPSHLVFTSPSSRAVPTTVFIPGSVLDLSSTANNYVRVSDRNYNEILPETSVEYSFYVPSFVGYRNVFATQNEAETDALSRLNQTVGVFVSAENLVVESSEMRDVPTMWGPAVMEVRVWH